MKYIVAPQVLDLNGMLPSFSTKLSSATFTLIPLDASMMTFFDDCIAFTKSTTNRFFYPFSLFSYFLK